MTENRGDVSITLWDSSADPPEDAGQVYRWNGYAEKDSVHALLQYADTHGERLRRKYLAWVHELGESRIRGKRLIDVLALEDGLSYWWMTLFVEKSPWKSPAIVDAIRLLALEEIVLQEKPDKLRLVSANRNLHEVLRGLCRNLDIAYEWQRVPDKPRPLSLTGIYRALPVPAQALVNLGRYLWERWPLRRAEKSGWFAGDEALFVCSYFTYMVPHQAVAGHFHSRHWEDLHGLMGKLGLSGNWLQHYYPHDAVPNPRVAMEWVQRFNQQRQEEGFHTFLEAYLSWRIVARALKRWLKLNLISWRLSEIKQAFCPQGSNLSLWPLMRGDWYASMRGPVAILNLLWIELFDEALHDLPHQKKGLYLYENQGWERALIHAWRKHGHGQLIAVAHGSNRRFWDLRYFTDSRTVRSSGPRSMPQPDLVALNGKTAIQDYLGLDYPKRPLSNARRCVMPTWMLFRPGRH
jgi:surface carbohydrate biosynthesis protein (TIGR04326 family)